MTNGMGTQSVPKDVRFESYLLKEFHQEKFEKIIYYDSAIIVKNGKRYGKIIICDDSVYTFIDAIKTFNIAALFKDIISVEMLSDKPMFIFGHQRNKAVHIKINYYRYDTTKTMDSVHSNISKPVKLQNSQRFLNESEIDEVHNEQNNNSLESSNVNVTSEIKNQTKDCIDYYILNINSTAFSLLKKARVDCIIRETMMLSLHPPHSTLYLSSSLVNRLFDELFLDLSLTQKSLSSLQEHLKELVDAGNKYYRLKVLFWSKPNLYDFMVTQFNNIGKSVATIKGTSQDSKILIYTYLNCLNTLLHVFNTYFFETDHFATKSKQLQLNNGKITFSLVESTLSLVAYLNECDKNDDLDLKPSELDLDIDCLKHSITLNSIELFYHLLCSSEMSVYDNDNDPFTMRTLLLFLESLVTFNSQDGIFNKFINQALHMQFIWIFPKMFKFDDQVLTPNKIINIYHFFSSVRIILQGMPKFLKFFQQEMEEEFEHFVLNDLSFPVQFPISSVTLKLLKSFQKNMVNKMEKIIDFF